MQIKIKKLNPGVKIPDYSHTGDAGLNLYSLEDYSLEPGERRLFKLGFAMEVPEGYAAIIWDRSGLAVKSGLHCMAGVIDAGFRGECGIVIMNTGKESHQIHEGDKLAQMLIQEVATNVEFIEAEELSDSSRKDNAWGSTGK